MPLPLSSALTSFPFRMSCRIHLQRSGNYRVVRLEGVDFSPVQQTEFRAAIQSMLVSSDTTPVAIWTSGLGVVGSCCLAALIEAAMACHRQGIAVVIVEDRAQVLEVFEVVSLHSIVEVQISLEDLPGEAISP